MACLSTAVQSTLVTPDATGDTFEVHKLFCFKLHATVRITYSPNLSNQNKALDGPAMHRCTA